MNALTSSHCFRLKIFTSLLMFHFYTFKSEARTDLLNIWPLVKRGAVSLTEISLALRRLGWWCPHSSHVSASRWLGIYLQIWDNVRHYLRRTCQQSIDIVDIGQVCRGVGKETVCRASSIAISLSRSFAISNWLWSSGTQWHRSWMQLSVFEQCVGYQELMTRVYDWLPLHDIDMDSQVPIIVTALCVTCGCVQTHSYVGSYCWRLSYYTMDWATKTYRALKDLRSCGKCY